MKSSGKMIGVRDMGLFVVRSGCIRIGGPWNIRLGRRYLTLIVPLNNARRWKTALRLYHTGHLATLSSAVRTRRSDRDNRRCSMRVDVWIPSSAATLMHCTSHSSAEIFFLSKSKLIELFLLGILGSCML